MRPRVDRHLVRRQDAALAVVGVDSQGMGPGRAADVDLDLVGRPPLADQFAAVEREGQVVDVRPAGVGADPDPAGDQALGQGVDPDGVLVPRVDEPGADGVGLGEPVGDRSAGCAGLLTRFRRRRRKSVAGFAGGCVVRPAPLRGSGRWRSEDPRTQRRSPAAVLSGLRRSAAPAVWRVRRPAHPAEFVSGVSPRYERHLDLGTAAEEPVGLQLSHLDHEPVRAGSQVALRDERDRRGLAAGPCRGSKR